MSMTLDELVDQLKKVYGAQLRAVVLYGSAAAGEHIAKRSDYNVLVIVESLAPDRIVAASAATSAWADAGNPAPMTLTMQEWRSSADIFAMEYADLLERHRVLFGTLPTDVQVKPSDLRLQLEHEAMGTLLQLRRAVLAAGQNTKDQLALLERSSTTIMVLFRAVLRLNGQKPSHDNIQLSEQTASMVGVSAEPFVAVLRHKRGEQSLPSSDVARALAGYLSGMEGLARYLDRYVGNSR
jgi:predicted nucleotidyltransferase